MGCDGSDVFQVIKLKTKCLLSASFDELSKMGLKINEPKTRDRNVVVKQSWKRGKIVQAHIKAGCSFYRICVFGFIQACKDKVKIIKKEKHQEQSH